MKTPKDVISDVLREHNVTDADKISGEIIFSLAHAGFALTKRRAAMPVASPRHVDPAEQKRQAVEVLEEATAERTREWMKGIQSGRRLHK